VREVKGNYASKKKNCFKPEKFTQKEKFTETIFFGVCVCGGGGGGGGGGVKTILNMLALRDCFRISTAYKSLIRVKEEFKYWSLEQF
jgi:hypothetical protein